MATAENYLEIAYSSPVFLTSSQLSSGSSSLIGLSAGLAGLIFIYTILQIFVKKDSEKIRKEQVASEQFVKNVKQLGASLFRIDILFKTYLLRAWGKIFTVVFVITWLVSVIVICTGIAKIIPGYGNTSGAVYGQIQAGLVLYFVSLIAYFSTRFTAFYKDKLEVRKKVMAHKKALANGTLDVIPKNTATGPVNVLNPVILLTLARDNTAREKTELTRNVSEKKFDRFFNYRRRIKHCTPVYKKITPSIFNGIQILVLLTEFVQLISFPVRDLFRSINFLESMQAPQGASSLAFVNGIESFLALFSTGLPNVDFEYVLFIFAWWLTIVAASSAIIFSAVSYLIEIDSVSEFIGAKYKRMISNFLVGRWILLTLPLINLFYLVILNAFLLPLSCLSSNTTPTWPAAWNNIQLAAQSRIYACYGIHDAEPSMNTWYALSGFTIAFFLFTIARTAYEPKPEEGVINYTPKAELWLKMAAISLLIIYSLIPDSSTATARGIIAFIILFFMVSYNIVIGSTHARWMNFARTLSFISTLWLCAVVTYFTSEANTEILYRTGSGVWIVVIVGWIILWALFVVADFFLVQPWEFKCHSESKSAQEDIEAGYISSDDSSSVGSLSGPRDIQAERNRGQLGPRPMPSIETLRDIKLYVNVDVITTTPNVFADPNTLFSTEQKVSRLSRGSRPMPFPSSMVTIEAKRDSDARRVSATSSERLSIQQNSSSEVLAPVKQKNPPPSESVSLQPPSLPPRVMSPKISREAAMTAEPVPPSDDISESRSSVVSGLQSSIGIVEHKVGGSRDMPF